MGYCKARDLGSLSGTEQDKCRWSEGVAIIKNGVVCYTGTATGSLAYYFCDEGYELNVLRGAIVNPRVNPRVCQQNGQWSIPGPECTNNMTTFR